MSGRARLLDRLFVDVVYPKRCAGCNRRGDWVCRACAATFVSLGAPWCLRCGTPTGHVCRCHELAPELDVVRSAASYEGWVRRAIIAMKFSDEPARADSLGPLIAHLVSELLPIDSLLPVPLHAQRQRERGFNQSEALARVAAGERLPVRTDVLLRTRPTRHQVGLGADERRANVHGAFAVRSALDLTGLRFLLVDDVLTTGATLGNCAQALKSAGASFVGAVTIARE